MIRKNEKMGGRPFFEKVQMRRGEPITAILRTPEGQPAAGVKVLAYSVTNKAKGGFEYGSFADCRTDAQGRFRLVVTTPGEAVFWLLPEKFAPSTHRIKGGQRGDLGTFTLEPGPVLRGKVLDVRGRPVPGVNVNADRRGRGEDLQDLMVADAIARSAVTDAKGEFVMNPLPPGEFEVKVDPHVRDNSRDDRKPHPVPGVFVGQKVTLNAGVEKTDIEVREVPHVVIEAQYVDSKGKPTRGHAPHIFGQIDKGFWFAEAKVDANGKVTAMVPHGLENVRMDLMTNEHGALRYRKARGEPLAFGRQVDLGTLNDDVRGIEIVRYVAPVAIVKVAAKDGMALSTQGVSAAYSAKKGQREFIPVNGPPTDVFFNKQGDGRYRSSQLLPDEEVTITAQAEGCQPRSVTLRLPEGVTRDVELILERAPGNAKKGDSK
jgi:hypothetical protein